MGVKLMVEVLDHAPPDWTQSERLIVLAIAEQANDRTRRGYPGIELIAHRAGVDVDSVSRALRRLAGKGTELRVPTGIDKTGRTVYAHRSHRTVYEIPKLCPADEHQTSACLERPDHRPAIGAEEAEEAPDPGPAIPSESPDHRPAITEERADGGPPSCQQRPDGGPERPDPGPERADGGPAHPLNTLTSPQGGVGGNDHRPSSSPRNVQHQQPSLIPERVLKLSQSEQVVLDWLRWRGGYPDTTHDEARAVAKAVRHRYGTKATLRYFEGMADPDRGGGFADYLDEVRKQRAAEVDQQVQNLEAAEPACMHGVRGGQALHPAHQVPLCPLCRRGVGAGEGARAEELTDRPVAAVVNQYRRAYHAALGSAPRTSLLVDVTQQATALLGRGADAQQLADLAHRAGARGEGLVTAATRGEPK